MRAPWIVVLLALLPTAATSAAAGDRTIRANPFIDGQYDILDGGRRTGSVRENPFIEGQLDVYDAGGRRTGTVRENAFIDGQWDVDLDRPDD